MSRGCTIMNNSPIISRSILCKTTSCKTASMSSPRILNPTQVPSTSSSSSSPSSPLALSVQKQKTNHQEVNNTSLKRKRPTRLHVPFSTLSFDANSNAPEGKCGVDSVDEVEVKSEEYSVYCKRGRRCTMDMEDRYSAVLGIQGNPKKALFGVFDGHGGAEAAEFASRNLDKNIVGEVSGRCQEDIKEAVRNAYISTDEDFLKKDVSSGTCCVTALIHGGDLVVSNVGDCRAVLSRGGVAEALTSDHKPSSVDEKERIENSGGYVDFCRGVWRIHGSLAVSRGIGDRHLKQWVIAEPETKVVRIDSDCEFLVLASDGLWDKVSNQEAVDIVHPLCVGSHKPDLFGACKKLVDLSKRKGSTDDISVLIVQLGCFIP